MHLRGFFALVNKTSCFPKKKKKDTMHSPQSNNLSLLKDSVREDEKRVQDNIDDDCWGMIFKLVKKDDPEDFASVSLVCKKFLSITNQMKTSLIVSDLTALHLPRALQRFQHIRSICIHTNLHEDDVESLIFQIARSGPQHLEALEILYPEYFPSEGLRELGMSTNGLKKLKCVGISMSDEELILLSDLFPCLEDLYLDVFKILCDHVSDSAVEVLASNLKNLKKVTLCNFDCITDESIMSLSTNCEDLTGVEIQYCQNVTENGIGFLMQFSTKLTTLALVLSSEQSFSDDDCQFTMENSLAHARNLEEIQFLGMALSDDLLCNIANYCTSLKRVDLDTGSTPCNFTLVGLMTMLYSCSSLKSFSIRIPLLDDPSMFDLCQYLRGLTYINVRNCSILTCASFFKITQACPSLETLIMDGTRVGIYKDVDLVLNHNISVKNISMKSCEHLNDLSLFRFVLVCPYIESLDISDCAQNFTGDGISRVLRSCPEMKHLNIGGVKVSNFLGLDEMPLKLKNIQANGTLIDDEGMREIGERCPKLEEINIGGCDMVTDLGVRLLVSHSEKLTKINMQGCKFSSPRDLLDWIIENRPSLKEIVPPSGYVPSEELQNLFLARGCLLLRGF